jgi:protein phosphatase
LPLAAAGVLLVLLIVVLVLLVRRLRAANAGGEAEPIENHADLTRIRAFTPDLLPRLSLDDPEEEEQAASEDSSPELRFEGDSAMGVDEPTGSHEVFATAAAGQTDRGRKRRRNEDVCLVDPALDLYMVADGMGGYAGGDVASSMAVKAVHDLIKKGKPVEAAPGTPKRGKQLREAVERANDIVYKAASKRNDLAGMGTTIVTALFSRRKQRVYIAHVGDSRFYRLRNGKLQVLTTDHTLGAKGVTGPLASNVRRAVGVAANVKVDLLVDTPMLDDIYLLCSDGMYKMLNQDQIATILTEHRADPSKAVTALVNASNEAGGKDNISVVDIDIRRTGAAA